VIGTARIVHFTSLQRISRWLRKFRPVTSWAKRQPAGANAGNREI
jgi:hypothetical protein